LSTFVDASSANNQSATSLVIPRPALAQPGHLAFLQAAVNTTAQTLGLLESGWTLLVSSPFAYGAGSARGIVAWKKLTATDTQVTLTTDLSTGKLAGAMACYNGFAADPIAAIGTNTFRASSVTTCVGGAINTTADNQRILGLFSEKSSTASSVSQGNMATRASLFGAGGGQISVTIMDEVRATAGVAGPRTATYNVASAVGYGLLLAIADGTALVQGPAGSSFTANLNRLAGTVGLSAQGAANKWAGTTGLSLVGALNFKAGTKGVELQGVVNMLAGTVGLGLNAASSRILG
jgi:hypothetical protein